MKRAMIDPEKCANCVPCSVDERCAKKAVIREEGAEKPWIDFYLCSGCMQCKTFCLQDAVYEIVQPCGNNKIGW